MISRRSLDRWSEFIFSICQSPDAFASENDFMGSLLLIKTRTKFEIWHVFVGQFEWIVSNISFEWAFNLTMLFYKVVLINARRNETLDRSTFVTKVSRISKSRVSKVGGLARTLSFVQEDYLQGQEFSIQFMIKDLSQSAKQANDMKFNSLSNHLFSVVIIMVITIMETITMRYN